MKATTRKNLFLLALPTLVVLVIITTLFWFFDRMKAAHDMRNQILLTLSTAQTLLMEILNAETSVRGYILTGAEESLTRYYTARDAAPATLKKLRDISFSPAAKKQVEILVPHVENKMRHLSDIREMKINAETDALMARLGSGEGRRVMELVRKEVENYLQLQTLELNYYDQRYTTSINLLFTFIVCASIIMLLFAQVFAYGIYRNIHQRLMNLVHTETKRSLETQEAMNEQLNLAYNTLQESEKKLDVTLNSIADAVIATDTDARITLMNHVAEELTGWSHADAVGRPLIDIFNIVHKESREPLGIPIMQTLLEGSVLTSQEPLLIGKEGAARNIADSCSPIRDDQGHVMGAVLVFRDITEENTARQALLDSTALLQTILATVVDGIVTFDVRTNLIETVNVAAEKMFGYSAAELIGKRFGVLIPELNEDKGSLNYYNASAEEQANGIVREVIGQLKNGQQFPLEIAVSEMSLGGRRYFTGVLRNITARKYAEAIMRDSEERYSNLFNTIDEAFCTIEMLYENNEPVDYRFLEVNPSFEKQTGLTNATGKCVFELIPELDRVWLDIYDGVLVSGEPIRFIHEVPEMNRWFDVYACPEKGLNSKKVILLFTDITERKRAEQALRESDERVRLATEATGVGIWEWNLANQTVQWDAQMFRIYGIEPTDDGFVEYNDWASYLLPEDLLAQQQALQEAVNLPTQSTREFRIQHQGEKGYRHIKSVEIMRINPKGEVESIVGTNLDITETKQTEQSLRENDRHLRAVIDALPVAIYTTDAKGALVHFNQTAVEFSGRRPELGVDHWCISEKLFRPDGSSLPLDQSPMARALREGSQIMAAEAIAERPDGSRVWFNAYPTPLHNEQGELIGGINMLIDITERKRLDQVILENNIELKKAKNLAEKANLAKSDFLSNMSHELRTPLSAILGFGQLIEASNPPPTPSQKRSVEQILQAGWYLLELINEILDLTLIESGKLSLAMEPVSLAELLLECHTMIEPQALQSNVALSFPKLDSTFVVNADYIRLKQILINLLSNAIKYNREHGQVTVTCFESPSHQMRIRIEDTGEGIPPESLDQLFQPFNRLGKENGPQEGTGIGLVMTKRLTELMGGAIDVESTLGQGTAFWIDLEMIEQTLVKGGATPAEPTSDNFLPLNCGATKRTILYVEDNPANLLLIEEIMAPYPDIVLLSARDGYSGIELARIVQPDLVLMDINLPGISGVEVLKILAKDPITTHIPVIALSANAIPRDIEDGLKAGFFRYLTKPIKINEFMNTLNLALEFGDRTSNSPNEEKMT